MDLIFLAVLVVLADLFILFTFVRYCFQGKLGATKLLLVTETWAVAFVPFTFLLFLDLFEINDCCSDSAVFSPEHRIGIYILIIAYSAAYLVSAYREKLFAPIQELLINTMLLAGLVINVLLCLHLAVEEGIFLSIFGNVPILLLLLIRLNENHRLFQKERHPETVDNTSLPGKISLYILTRNPILKYPIMAILLAPLCVILSLILMLFGQKPDSMIRAFTETYKHGFSQLDHLCENVDCGGHFLCSVGANGHKNLVKPIRYGERNSRKIICNRQLLVSNAFEELIQEKFPWLHKKIRLQYNKVGSLIHKYYYLFNIKLISDFVYILMKPLEFVFLLVLYTFDQNPENRIAMQYLKASDKEKINSHLQKSHSNPK